MFENLKTMTADKKAMVKDNNADIMGAHSAIKNFVEAKKGESNQVDKGKTGILRSILKTFKKKNK